MLIRLVALLLASVVAACGTTAYDPGPKPDAKAIITPQLDLLLPGSALTQGLTPIPAVATPVGAVEIGPVRLAEPLAPAGWIACLKVFDDKGQSRYVAAFFKEKLLVHHRTALPPDRCEGDTYTVLRKKKPGT